jgi:hypothetical protein
MYFLSLKTMLKTLFFLSCLYSALLNVCKISELLTFYYDDKATCQDIPVLDRLSKIAFY